MLAALDHPDLIYNWFTTVLLRWSNEFGLILYDQWAIGLHGFKTLDPGQAKGMVLLDTYYSAYLIAFVGILWFARRFEKQGFLKLRPHVKYDALLIGMVGVLVGAKTAYIFIYNPDFYFKEPATTGEMLQRIFLNWSGMASHGAATGIVICVFLWWLIKRVNVGQIGDLGCISGAFGAIWIRLANFLNGELYGRDAPEWLPWAMHFRVRNGRGNAYFVQNGQWFERVYETNDAGDRVAKLVETEPYRRGYEFLHSIDGQPTHIDPANVPDRLRFVPLEVITSARHPSQIYQLLLEGVLLLVFLLWVKRRTKRAGVVSGWFFIGYAVARIIGEFFRQPDVQFQREGNEWGFVYAFFSMGQMLSFGMLAVGLGLLAYFSRYGSIIAKLPMWPPEKGESYTSADASASGIGGETSAGDIGGITAVGGELQRRVEE